MSLIERAAYLYNHRIQTDCVIMVEDPGSGDHVRFQVHKLFLSMSSPVFEKMFVSNCKERDENIVIVDDIEPNIFDKLIKFIYMDQFDVDSIDEAMNLYHGADKYMIRHLVAKCQDFLTQCIGAQTACRIYEFAELFSIQNLQKSALEVIRLHTSLVLSQPSFLEIKFQTLLTIFSQEHLNVYSDCELFEALVRYADNHALKRKSVYLDDDDDDDDGDDGGSGGDSTPMTIVEHDFIDEENKMLLEALKHIHFLTFTSREFAKTAARSKLLESEEKVSIFTNIADPGTDYGMPEGFSTRRAMRCTPMSMDVFQSRAMVRTLNSVYHERNYAATSSSSSMHSQPRQLPQLFPASGDESDEYE